MKLAPGKVFQIFFGQDNAFKSLNQMGVNAQVNVKMQKDLNVAMNSCM